MKTKLFLIAALGLFGAALPRAAADTLDSALQAKVDAELKLIQTWAAGPAIVDAVKAEESAAAQEMKSQADAMKQSVAELLELVGITHHNGLAAALVNGPVEAPSQIYRNPAAKPVAVPVGKQVSSPPSNRRKEIPMTDGTAEF